MRPHTLICCALLALSPFGAAPAVAEDSAADLQKLARQVADSERAFAKTMADRDFGAFQKFVSAEAVFFDGNQATRGRTAIAAAWKPLYDGAAAPFSWEPEKVEVLESGKLALSTGKVRSPSGKVVAQFNSIWRLEAPGTWRVVFDKGCVVCQQCKAGEQPQG
jgi:ketosteroid isomerase-like protein